MTRLSGKSSMEIRAKMPKRMFDAYRELSRSIWDDGTLEVTLREMLRLKSAELAKCVH